MAKKEIDNFEISGDFEELPLKKVENTVEEKSVEVKEVQPTAAPQERPTLVNPLRNERVIVRRVPKLTGIWGNNPKHVLSGGMAEGATKTYVVPRLSSGIYVNILTDEEKAFLEDIMGLEYNALSIYKKVGNFWDDSNDEGISRVRLNKDDNYLDLSVPEDYIRYKILLANKDFIAPSMKALQDQPKATYQYVIVKEGDDAKIAKSNMSTTMQCYKEYGKIEDDADTLRVIVELIEGRPLAASTKLEFIQTKINNLIQSNNKLFLQVIQDPLLKTRVLIKKSVEAGLISVRGTFYYLRSDNSPLCEDGEEPTLSIAAKYLNMPKHQEIKFMLEAKINK